MAAHDLPAPAPLGVAVLCTRDVGGRATGRVSVLRSHLVALEALGHRVRVVVVSERPPAPTPWSERFETVHVRAPGLVSVALSAAGALAPGPLGRWWQRRTGRPSTLNESLYVDPRVRREVAAAVSGCHVVVADGLRLSSAADRVPGVPVVVDLDDLLGERYRRRRQALRAARGTPGGAARSSVLGIAAERVPAGLRPLAERAALAVLDGEARRASAREEAVVRTAAAVSLVSPEEASALSERCQRPVSWLPPTVQVPPSALPAGEGLVFLGGLDYPPNAEAVRFWRDAVVPELRRAAAGRPVPPLHLVGHCPEQLRAELSGPDLVLDGYVDDLPAALTRRAMVAPLLDPGGVKLKVLDALALGLPVVGTPQAFDGTGLPAGLRCGGADARSLAAAVLEVLEDDALRDQLARGGRAHAEAVFSPAASARRWAQVLAGLPGLPAAPGRTGALGAGATADR
ncbi:glycosyltransferase [Quadrisphaera sp. KR29]|uniref:glycosyltransferase n=1 Tax=Quadrisphaera sp. KR29 TaxID=3461391 RepID=UPI004043B846